MNPPVPLAHYRCSKCGHEWRQPASLVDCPRCGFYERINWLNWPDVCLAANGTRSEFMSSALR